VAPLSVGAAALLAGLIPPLHQAPFIPFFAAVVVTAAHAGLWPGLGATVLSSLIIDYFFLPPEWSLSWGIAEMTRLGSFVGLAVLASVLASRHRRAELALTTRLAQQEAVTAFGQRALTATSRELMDEVVRRVAEVLEVEYCKVLQLLPDGRALRLVAGVGWKPGLVGQATVGAGLDSQAGFTLHSAGPVIVEDLRAETRFSGPPLLTEHGVVSGISVIIHGYERPWGVLGAHTARRRAFSRHDIDFLQATAGVLAAAVERDRIEEDRGPHEEAIEESLARYRAVLEGALDCIVVMDHRGQIMEFNPAAEQTFGYARGEAVGRDMAELIIPPAQRERHRAGLARYLATGESGILGRRVEFTAVRKDGTEFPVELAVIRLGGASPPLFAGFVRDISERLRALEADRKAEALRSVTRLANAAAHEINNPLFVIMGSLELMAPAAADEATRTRIMDMIEAGRRIKEIVRRMSRITALELTAPAPGAPEFLDLNKSAAPAQDDPAARPRNPLHG
jgi:PAS domain S-box-containing protein